MIRNLLGWLVRLYPASGAAGFLLDAVEHTFAIIPKDYLEYEPPAGVHTYGVDRGWRQEHGMLLSWLSTARHHREWCPDEWRDEDHVRFWHLLRWMDEPAAGVSRHRPLLNEVLLAYCAGAATEADLLDQLLGARQTDNAWNQGFPDLYKLSGRKPDPLETTYPFLTELVDQCRERILDVELQRGDRVTAASAPALALRHTGDGQTLVALLRALGKDGLVRSRSGRRQREASRVQSTHSTDLPIRNRFLGEFRHKARESMPSPMSIWWKRD